MNWNKNKTTAKSLRLGQKEKTLRPTKKFGSLRIYESPQILHKIFHKRNETCKVQNIFFFSQFEVFQNDRETEKFEEYFKKRVEIVSERTDLQRNYNFVFSYDNALIYLKEFYFSQRFRCLLKKTKLLIDITTKATKLSGIEFETKEKNWKPLKPFNKYQKLRELRIQSVKIQKWQKNWQPKKQN